jgi:hypothetical protein
LKIRSALLVVAASVLLPAAPSHAAEARLCDAGFVGVIVDDANGELARACVRTSDVTDVVNPVKDAAVEAVNGVRDRADQKVTDVRDWADKLAHPHCVYYPDSGTIACENWPPPLH